MSFKIKLYPLLAFIFTFILFTPIGTISHEYGHIAAAKYLGYDTDLSYGSMTWYKGSATRLSAIYKKNESAIKNKESFPEEEEYKKLLSERRQHALLITIGGPLQTMSVGCLGLLILFFRKNTWHTDGLKLPDWLAVFLSLFWLREAFNLVMSIALGILNGNGEYFGSEGDEVRISRMLDLPAGTVPLLFGCLGIIVAYFVIFRIIPDSLRFTFILGGLIGGISGFVLWMEIVGPVLMP